MKLGKDFIILPSNDKETKECARIELTCDPFAGIIYSYDTVKFLEPGQPDHPGDNLVYVQFSYNLIERPEDCYWDQEEFEEIIGKILNVVVEEAVNQHEGKMDIKTSGSR